METAKVSSEVVHQFRFFKVYKNGHIEKCRTIEKIPPSIDDPKSPVQSKDIIVQSQPELSVRIFKLKSSESNQSRLPLVFYIHGGGFCLESAFSPRHHNYVSTLVANANVIAVSVEYGMFPERPIPAFYDDSWVTLQWVASHADGSGPDPWLNEYTDFKRVFLVGNIAGGNIAHHLAVRVGSMGLSSGVRVVGMVLIHPYFGGTDDDKMWLYMCPSNSGLSDPRLKPDAGDLAVIGCERVLVFVAELDHLRDVGKSYCEELKRSGWKGEVEMVENEEEGHCFYWFKFDSEEAASMMNKICIFLNQFNIVRTCQVATIVYLVNQQDSSYAL